jgi:hypothetical protein
MKKTIEIELQTIDTIKLDNPKLYQKIIDKNRDILTDDWYQYIYDDVKTMLGFCGFNDPKIHFSGFYSQGDGANFTGNFYKRDIDFMKLAEYAPKEEFFLLFATLLTDLTNPFEDARFTLYKSGNHYEHEYTVSIKDFEFDNLVSYSSCTEEALLDACQKIMRYIYQKLEKEYEYRTSEEVIYEYLFENGYYFNENGGIQ